MNAHRVETTDRADRPVEYVICYTLLGRFAGNVGQFQTREAAEFFNVATRNGGIPERVATIVTMEEFEAMNESSPAGGTSDDESETAGLPRSDADDGESATDGG